MSASTSLLGRARDGQPCVNAVREQVRACLNPNPEMGSAFQRMSFKLMLALQLDVDSASGFVTAASRQVELNRLALDVDVATSQAGKRLAALYKAGHWPTLTVLPPATVTPPQTPAPAQKYAPPAPVPAKPDPGLKVNGITYGKVPVVIINGKAWRKATR